MKYWSLLFGLVTVFAIALFAYSPLDGEWWLPGYRETNADALATLEEIDERLGVEREALGVLAEAEPAVAEADSPGLEAPERTERLEALDALQRWLGRVSIRLGRIADSGFFPRRVADLQSRIAETEEELRSLQGLLASGARSEVPEASIEADAALERLEAANAALLAEVSGPLHEPLSTAAARVDHLYVFILIITGLTFIGVMAAFLYATWRYAADSNPKALYTHGSQRLEVVWTIIPAAVLVFIAIYQLGAWAEIKFRNTWPDVKPVAEVTARQFQWKMRYAGPDGKLGTADDLHTVNDLHFVKDLPTIIHLKSEDVLHSFFLPQLRVKQDAVPGMTIPVYFDAKRAGRYELLCAELCGWGHYKMRANVIVHETQSEFDEWMEQALREQNRGALETAPATAAAEAEGPRVE